MWDDWTLDDLRGFRKGLTEALAAGVTEVRHGDRTVKYQARAEMEKTLSGVDAAIKSRTGQPRRVNAYIGF